MPPVCRPVVPGKLRLSAVICAVLGLLLPSVSVAASEAPPLPAIVAECTRFGRGAVTSKGSFTIDSELFREPDGGPVPPTTVTGSWTLSGNRFQEDTVSIYPGLTRQGRDEEPEAWDRGRITGTAPASQMHGRTTRTVIFDGKQGRLVETIPGLADTAEEFTGSIASTRAAMRCEFWKWLGLVPPGARPGAFAPYPSDDGSGPLQLLGTEIIDGVECVKLRSRSVELNGEVVWWVAPAYDHLIFRKDEVRYFPPGQGLKKGQYSLVRTRVARVESFGSGLFFPTRVEKSAAILNANGTIARVIRRWTFTADHMIVNDSPGKRVYTASGSRR